MKNHTDTEVNLSFATSILNAGKLPFAGSLAYE